MLIPSFSIQQSSDCHTLYFKDTTCFYDALSCPCGYNSPNPSKADITKTVITIYTPGNQTIVLQKTYLPNSPAPLIITCADLAISATTTTTTTVQNDCGCGTITTSSTTTVPTTCFVDGCWSFKYDVYATETNITYSWDLGGSSPPFADGYCVTINIDGNTYTNSFLSTQLDLQTWLNTLNLGYFALNTTTHILSTSSFLHVYGDITFNDAQTSYTVDFTGCDGFDFPATLDSITIDGVTTPFAANAPDWNSVVAFVNSIGNGTFITGGYADGVGTIIQDSCSAGVINAMSFNDDICEPVINETDPNTTTITPDTSSVEEETIVGTVTMPIFLYCNINNAIRSFKLTQFSQDCGCTDSIQGSICELDSDFQTMLIAAGSSSCDCQCATNYLNKCQNLLSVLQKACP